MNKISALILAASLAISPMAAQNAAVPVPAETETSSAVADESSTIIDESEQLTMDADAASEATSEEAESYSDIFIRGMKDGMKSRGAEMDELEEMMIRDHMGYVVGVIAIIFGVPCLAIIAALIVILIYALKRNQRRNEIIRCAIENNYQLPDAFFTGQKSVQTAGQQRDPKKFYSAVTLIAIGFSVIIFALAENVGFFLLIGGIPLLIGIGRMLGYFYVSPSPKQPLSALPPQQPSSPFPPQQPGRDYPFPPQQPPVC